MPLFKVNVMATAAMSKVFEVEADSPEDALEEAMDLADDVEKWSVVLDGGDVEILDAELAED